jgi:hypothetical protein
MPKGRQKDRVKARDLLCFRCAVKPGISMTELAKRLDLSLAAVSCAVRRGEKAVKEANYMLEDYDFLFFKDVPLYLTTPRH